MKDYTTDNIRNVCLAGQRGCGKTSLADAIAFATGVNNRVGRVDDGSSFLDYTDGEISRKTSLSSKLLACPWKEQKINLFDCPGHADFVGELLCCVHVADAVGFLVDAAAGVEVGTQLQWKTIPADGLARFFFVNKMDKENVNWETCLNSIVNAFGSQAVAVQIPIGQAASFKGLVDLLHMKAYTFEGENRTEVDIPADIKAQADAQREKLIEAAAESDDALMEKFFEDGTLNDADMLKGLRTGIATGSLFPVMFGVAHSSMGVRALLDFMAEYLPAPTRVGEVAAVKTGKDEAATIKLDPSGPTVAYIFRTVSEGHLGDMSYFKVISGNVKPGTELVNETTGNAERLAQLYTFQGKNRIDLPGAPAGDIGVAVKLKSSHSGNTLAPKGFGRSVKGPVYPNPVMDVAVGAKSKGDEDKVATAFAKFREEDLTFRIIPDPALKQQVLWAQGSTHIEVLCEKVKSRFGVEVELSKPRIPYRETIRAKTEKQYKHKKQSGGRGQYGDVHLRIEPNTRGAGFEFEDAVTGGVIPGKYIPAVEKGVVEAMVSGGLCGAPVVDVKVAVFFGSYHDVDSSDMAFKIAGLMAFREGYMDCKPVILEPVYNIEVLVPDEFTGDVMGDLSSRRGKIAGMDPEGGSQRIRASVPQAELYQYSVDLRSMTQGQGVYSMEFARYEEVPHDAAQKIIDEAKALKEAEG
ncbi:MAG: elongation factor G [candidate division Zixibacteria bacterium]|nr:elongation factor G [candidate division Zixibacteria bacterium]